MHIVPTLRTVFLMGTSMALECGDRCSLTRDGRVPTGHGVWTAIAMGLLLLILVIGKRRLSSAGRRRLLPPGPAAWPVIGNLHLLVKGGLPFHHKLANLAKEYGPLMTMKFGWHTTIVVTSSKMAKEILKTQNEKFCSRSKSAASHIIAYKSMDIIYAPYGEYLRTIRRIVQTQLLSTTRVASFKKSREEEILGSVYSMLEACQEGTVPIDLVERMSQLSANNITQMLLGKSFFGRKSESSMHLKEFLETLETYGPTASTFIVGNFVPFLKRFDIGGHEAKLREIALTRDKFYSRILEEHRSSLAEKSQGEVPDFVDTLLALSAKDSLSDETMKAIISDMFLAGIDTTGNEISWAFAELMRHPGVVEKAVEELDCVVGRDRVITEADIPNLKYLQAIIKETFRLHPAIGIVQYESTEAAVIDGYHIPAKSRVYVNNYAISRSLENWKNAMEFIPERFLESTIDVKGQDFEMIPFGSGRRMCVGMNVGLLMVQLTVGQLLQVCSWSLPANMKPEDVDMTESPLFLIGPKNPLQVIATPRLAPSILNDYIASLD